MCLDLPGQRYLAKVVATCSAVRGLVAFCGIFLAYHMLAPPCMHVPCEYTVSFNTAVNTSAAHHSMLFKAIADVV
jgi:hypothetical protein